MCCRLAARHALKGGCHIQAYLHKGEREGAVPGCAELQHLSNSASTGHARHAQLVAAHHV